MVCVTTRLVAVVGTLLELLPPLSPRPSAALPQPLAESTASARTHQTNGAVSCFIVVPRTR